MSTVTPDAVAQQRLRLVIVGAGRMGGAVLQGAIGSGLLTAAEIAIFHPTPAALPNSPIARSWSGR